MIHLANVRYRYDEEPGEWVLNGIDLSIDKGEYLLLCGGSGSGKTTLAYLLNGLVPHFFDGTLEGSVIVDGRNTRNCTVADMITSVGLVFQNAEAQLFNSTVEDEIAFGLESLGLPAEEIEESIEQTASMLRIQHLLTRSPTTLSGGEKRLVAIASVLSLRPPVLVLDEPLAHLDWEGARKVREVLSDLHGQGATLVVIEQRMHAILEDATRCVVMDRGEILFNGSAGDALPTLREVHLVPHYPAAPEPDKREKRPLFHARSLSREIEGKTVLRDVSFHVNEGEIVAVVGKNGAGKTTLIKHFNGLYRSRKGEILFMGKEIRGLPPREMASRIGLSFQNPNDQFFKATVKDELTVGMRLANTESGEWLEELYTLFHLHELLEKSPYRLSEGQKKRVAVASILAMRPSLLVLDEPTVGQDGRFLEILAGLFVSLREKGFTIVMVTHDMEFALATAERWIVIHEGRVVGDGPPGRLLKDEALIQMGALGWEDRQTEIQHV